MTKLFFTAVLALNLLGLSLPVVAEVKACSVVSVSPEKKEISWTIPFSKQAFQLPDDSSSGPAIKWRIAQVGGNLESNRLTSSESAGRSNVLVANIPDNTSRQDRVYPTVIRFGDGAVALLSTTFVTPDVAGKKECVKFTASNGSNVSGLGVWRARSIAASDKSPPGYIVFGARKLMNLSGSHVLLDASLPDWAQIVIFQDAAAALKRYQAAMGPRQVPLIIGYAADTTAPQAFFWGDHLDGSVTLGLYGNWSKEAPSLQNKVRGFLDHELFHIWNGPTANRSESKTLLALEGGAEFSRLLLQDESAQDGMKALLADISKALNLCVLELSPGRTLSAVLNDAHPGQVPYDCGIVYMFLLAADSRKAQAKLRDDYYDRWSRVLNPPSPKLYSWQDLASPMDHSIVDGLAQALDSTEPASAFKKLFLTRGFSLQPKSNLSADEKMRLGMRLMWEVMALDCENQVGFATTDHGYQLDETLPACHKLRAGRTVTLLSGIDPTRDPEAAYVSVSRSCLATGMITVSYEAGADVSHIKCERAPFALPVPVSIVPAAG